MPVWSEERNRCPACTAGFPPAAGEGLDGVPLQVSELFLLQRIGRSILSCSNPLTCPFSFSIRLSSSLAAMRYFLDAEVPVPLIIPHLCLAYALADTSI